MSNDLNQCMFTGRLGGDPDAKFIPSGDAVTNFTIAVGSQWKDRDTGEKRESTQWIKCVAWRKTAELIGSYLAKGSRVLVVGKWQTRSWDDQDGNKKYMTECVVDQIIFLDGKSEQAATPAPKPEPEDDDIPF
jgi:single-strand DNA-binding protein